MMQSNQIPPPVNPLYSNPHPISMPPPALFPQPNTSNNHITTGRSYPINDPRSAAAPLTGSTSVLVGEPLGVGALQSPRNVKGFVCPLSGVVMSDPVMCPDGHTFDRQSILSALSVHPVCPVDGKHLTAQMIFPNNHLKAQMAAEMPQGVQHQCVVALAGAPNVPNASNNAPRGPQQPNCVGHRDRLSYAGPSRSCCCACTSVGKCFRVDNLSPAARIGLIAGVAAIGVGLLLLGCGLYHDWVPFVCVVPFVLMMPPIWLCNLWKSSSSTDILSTRAEEGIATLIGQFLVGTFSVSSVGILLVLLHTALIGWQAVCLCIGACIIFTIAGILLLKSLEDKDDFF